MDRKLKLKESSNLKGGTYDPQTGRLTVQLKDRHYAYHSVPEDLIDQLESATDSHGEFFSEHIKPHHEFTRVR